MYKIVPRCYKSTLYITRRAYFPQFYFYIFYHDEPSQKIIFYLIIPRDLSLKLKAKNISYTHKKRKDNRDICYIGGSIYTSFSFIFEKRKIIYNFTRQ